MKSAELATPVKPVPRVIPFRRAHDRRKEELAFLPAALEIVETPPSPIGRTIGATLVELMTSPAEVARARAEFALRTGGGIGGTNWVPPLLPKGFRAPVHYRWPEYVTTPS